MSSCFARTSSPHPDAGDSDGLTEPEGFNVKFLDIKFWSHGTDKKVTWMKLILVIKYYLMFLWTLSTYRPKYVLYNISWYKMPWPKDALFCITSILLGRKLILHDHGQYVNEFQSKIKSWILNNATASIILGNNVVDKYYGLMPISKLFVVPGAVSDMGQCNRWPKKTLNILYLSYLSHDKGAEVAFDAMRSVLEQTNVTVTFAGPIENDCIALQLDKLQDDFPNRVNNLGYIENDWRKYRLFRNADIFIFPTIREAFGLVLLEAMSTGLPIVASSEGCIPEILPNGLLFKKGNVKEMVSQVLLLIHSQQLRNELGNLNRNRYEENYTIDIYGKRMIKAFQEMEKYGR